MSKALLLRWYCHKCDTATCKDMAREADGGFVLCPKCGTPLLRLLAQGFKPDWLPLGYRCRDPGCPGRSQHLQSSSEHERLGCFQPDVPREGVNADWMGPGKASACTS